MKDCILSERLTSKSAPYSVSRGCSKVPAAVASKISRSRRGSPWPSAHRLRRRSPRRSRESLARARRARMRAAAAAAVAAAAGPRLRDQALEEDRDDGEDDEAP